MVATGVSPAATGLAICADMPSNLLSCQLVCAVQGVSPVCTSLAAQIGERRQHMPGNEVVEVMSYLQQEKGSAAAMLVGHESVRGQAAVLGALLAAALSGEDIWAAVGLKLCLSWVQLLSSEYGVRHACSVWPVCTLWCTLCIAVTCTCNKSVAVAVCSGAASMEGVKAGAQASAALLVPNCQASSQSEMADTAAALAYQAMVSCMPEC